MPPLNDLMMLSKNGSKLLLQEVRKHNTLSVIAVIGCEC